MYDSDKIKCIERKDFDVAFSVHKIYNLNHQNPSWILYIININSNVKFYIISYINNAYFIIITLDIF